MTKSRICIRKALNCWAGLTVLFWASLSSVQAETPSPSIVIDVASGKVLHSEYASNPWYPASITKLMTLYVALQEVQAGRAKMDQLLTMSATAAKLPPSKMGFKPGTKVRLDNALVIIMVKSANDVAAMIAENLGGSEKGFAAKMNQAARDLGMQESHFVNAHGLPNKRQVVSARDMAILARAILLEFPEHANLFQIGAIRFGKKVMKNHNGLIGRYPGATGMKTGFICSSGFNLVSSAKQNGRQVLAVVLGAPSARERNNKAAELLNKGFSSFGVFTTTLDAWPSNAGTEPPDLRSEICKKNVVPLSDDDTSAPLSGSAADSGNPLSTIQAQAYAPPEDHPSLAPVAKAFTPVVVWTGLYPPGTKAPKGSDETNQKVHSAEDGGLGYFAPLPPLRPSRLSWYQQETDMEPLQLR